MSLQEQADKLRKLNLFDEARDCYDKYCLPFTSTYSLVDTFSWPSAIATSSVDWSTINGSISEHWTVSYGYTPNEVFEAFYPKELYPEKYI